MCEREQWPNGPYDCGHLFEDWGPILYTEKDRIGTLRSSEVSYRISVPSSLSSIRKSRRRLHTNPLTHRLALTHQGDVLESV